MNTFTQEQKKDAIAQNYARIASDDESCGCSPSGCCGSENISLELGYSKEQLNSIPSEAEKGFYRD